MAVLEMVRTQPVPSISFLADAIKERRKCLVLLKMLACRQELPPAESDYGAS